jgi:hypothetical protein
MLFRHLIFYTPCTMNTLSNMLHEEGNAAEQVGRLDMGKVGYVEGRGRKHTYSA